MVKKIFILFFMSFFMSSCVASLEGELGDYAEAEQSLASKKNTITQKKMFLEGFVDSLQKILTRNSLEEKDKIHLSRSLQNFFEHKYDGAKTRIVLMNNNLKLSITILNSFKIKTSGTYCREYSQRIVLHGDAKTYNFVTCRNKKKSWENLVF